MPTPPPQPETAVIEVVLGDITELEVDGVVNAANEWLVGGGGVDGAIHQAAGPQLVEACLELPEIQPGVRCPTGAAVVTPAFEMNAQVVIHAVGPVWRGGDANERALLASCYANAMRLAKEHQLQTVAFPAISCGAYGFPIRAAVAIALRTIRSELTAPGSLRKVLLVAYEATIFEALEDELRRVEILCRP